MKKLAARNFEDLLQVSNIPLLYEVGWLITQC